MQIQVGYGWENVRTVATVGERALGWLRRQAAQNITMVGVSGGPFILAKAGLLKDHRTTIHWDHWAAFMEGFSLLQVESACVIDRKPVTCARDRRPRPDDRTHRTRTRPCTGKPSE